MLSNTTERDLISGALIPRRRSLLLLESGGVECSFESFESTFGMDMDMV